MLLGGLEKYGQSVRKEKTIWKASQCVMICCVVQIANIAYVFDDAEVHFVVWGIEHVPIKAFTNTVGAAKIESKR